MSEVQGGRRPGTTNAGSLSKQLKGEGNDDGYHAGEESRVIHRIESQDEAGMTCSQECTLL